MLVAKLLASVVVMTFSIYMSHATSWSLQSDPETVDLANTDKVELSCMKGHSESPAPFLYVNSMHITKLIAYGINETLASMNFATGTVTTIDANFLAHGSDDGLTIETTNVTYALGRYECVINGIGKLNQVIQISLPPVSITKREVTIADVLDRLQQHDREIKSMIRSLKSEVKSNLTYISKAVDEINMTLDTILKERSHNPTCPTQKSATQKQTSDKPEPTEPPASSWPKGEYTLYEPSSGCPSDPSSAWKNQWLAFASEQDGQSRNNASSDNHFRPPLFFQENGNPGVNMTLCFHSDTTSSFSWSKGSYCIGHAGSSRSCIKGFTYGEIRLNHILFIRRSPGNKDALAAFCCRDDGHPTSPISLPVNKPFYLNRLGGTCQQVDGMTVREEFMTIDIKRSDRNSNTVEGMTPDVTLNPVTLYFCYYFVTK